MSRPNSRMILLALAIEPCGLAHGQENPVSPPLSAQATAPAMPAKAEAPQGAQWNILNITVMSLYEKGQYDQAIEVAKRALELAEKTKGPDHADVATSLNNLAFLYYSQANYTQAEPLYKRSLAIREKTFGADDHTVATSLKNLATLYLAQGRYGEAEPLCKRALAIWEKALGEANHGKIVGAQNTADLNRGLATGLNNLAELYVAKKHYSLAEPLYERALSIREKEPSLGPNHPDVAKVLINLGNLYRAQGKPAHATEALYKRALAILEKAHGPDHPDLALSLTGLGELAVAQRQYTQAEPYLDRALAIREKGLAANHPLVAQSLRDIADLDRKTGRAADAVPLEKRAAAIESIKR